MNEDFLERQIARYNPIDSIRIELVEDTDEPVFLVEIQVYPTSFYRFCGSLEQFEELSLKTQRLLPY